MVFKSARFALFSTTTISILTLMPVGLLSAQDYSKGVMCSGKTSDGTVVDGLQYKDAKGFFWKKFGDASSWNDRYAKCQGNQV
jgi:hypothetical protein